jgi:penicillin amidase
VWLWVEFKASLPLLDGTHDLKGLQSRVTVERDGLGVPTVYAGSRLDAARATGFLHAQDRFFQMDLSRRAGAGELAELLGSALLDTDRELRLHRCRIAAVRLMTQAPAPHLELSRAYCEGVNAGLAALGAKPPEYFLLRSSPQPWRPEDTLLVAYAMFFMLQDERAARESALATLHEVLPPSAFAFFAPLGSDWDAALDGSVLPKHPVPPPAEFSYPKTPAASSAVPPTSSDNLQPGSNNWAVDGRISRTGAALVANDMHLGLRLPNTWYRMRIVWREQGAGAPESEVAGVTLPGAPAVVVGSNTHIAWTFTNSMLDMSDLVELETAPDDPRRYRTPDGWRRTEETREIIRVRGAREEPLIIESSVWGPIVAGPKGTPRRALSWAPHLPEAVNLNLIELEGVRDAESALRLAPFCGVPAQNFVVGDRSGQIGWSIIGWLPKRRGFDGRLPTSWADGARGWDGRLEPERYPRVLSPAGGRVWTANNRVSGAAEYIAAGPWEADLGARARQIRDRLLALESASPQDMLDIQLDDRALFLERWRNLLLTVLARRDLSERSDLQEVRELLERWGGRAAIQSAGYSLVRGFRRTTIDLALEPLVELCRKRDPEFDYRVVHVEQTVWTLLQERPAHLLNPRFRDFDALLLTAAEEVLKDLQREELKPAEATWGRRNLVEIRHPLSRGIPWLGRWFDLSAQQLPGDSNMPRAQGAGWGASERLVVSPGHESEGLFHMPGGQSGHFLSPYYRAGHDAWAEGRPTPFLPGVAKHRLVLTPSR